MKQTIEHINAGDLPQAIPLIDSCFKYVCIEDPTGKDEWLVYITWLKARLLTASQRFQESEEVLLDIIDTHKYMDVCEDHFLARLHGELGTIYEKTLNHEKALVYLKKALTFEIRSHNTYMTIYRPIAESYLHLGLADSSVKYMNSLLDILREAGDTTDNTYAFMMMYLAKAYRKNEQWNLAESLTEEALNIWPPHHMQRSGYAFFLEVAAMNYKGMEQCDRALPLFKKAERVFLGTQEPRDWLSGLFLYQGYCFSQLGMEDSVYSRYIRAPALVKSRFLRRSSFLSLQGKEIFANKSTGGRRYMLHMLDYFDNSYPDYNKEVYNYLLFYKGHSMKSLKGLKDLRGRSADPAFDPLYDSWLDLRTRYYQSLATDSAHPDTLLAYTHKLERIEKQLFQIANLPVSSLEMEYSNFAEVRSSLDHKEVAIEFFRFRDVETEEYRYGAMLIFADRPYPLYVPLFDEGRLEKLLKKRFAETDFEYVQRVYGQSDSLYQLIWKPLELKPGEQNRIYVSYAGLLHLIPHNALSISKGKILSDRFQLYQCNSTSDVGRIKQMARGKLSDVALFGGIQYDLPNETSNSTRRRWPYLESSEREVDEISEMLKKRQINTQLFKGVLASEEAFKSQMNTDQPSIIHISTHGQSLDNSGHSYNLSQTNSYARSGLVMAAQEIDGLEDGILSAPEIANLNLSNTELVIMSACESGLGEISNTDEVYGLQRAFKIAGVDQVIYTLWKIPDEQSMEFMIYFYEMISLGHDAHTALKLCRAKMKSSYSTYYWAAFQLMN